MQPHLDGYGDTRQASSAKSLVLPKKKEKKRRGGEDRVLECWVGSITAGAGIVQSCKILFVFSQGNEYLLGKPKAINSW